MNEEQGDGGDSVARLVARLHEGAPTSSVQRSADRVLRRAEPTARATCRSRARDLPPDRVEELVQDTLEIVWNRLADFRPEQAQFEVWVRGIALNVCRNARRKRRDLLTDDGVLEASDPAHSTLRLLQREQRDALVTEAIEAGLQGIEQEVLYHRYCHDLRREQIAHLLQLEDADAVRVILIRARRHLKEEILARLKQLEHSTSLLRSSEEI
jgi:RNA polymerase sigma factor (sigma-70 family)